MGGFSIQFYAFPNEISDFIKDVQNEFHYFIVRFDFHPFRATLIATKEDKLSALDLTSGVYKLYSYLPDMSIDKHLVFLDKNLNSIHLEIGMFSNGELSESTLSTLMNEEIAFIQAKKVASKLKKITKAGVIFRNVDTNAEALSRIHRYTQQVQKSCITGLRLLSLSPKNIGYLPEA